VCKVVGVQCVEQYTVSTCTVNEMRVNVHTFCGLLGYTRSVRVLDLVGSIITIRGSGGNYGNATI
jgi:hypothetical protein